MKIKLEKIDYGRNQQKFYNISIDQTRLDNQRSVFRLNAEYGRLYTMGKKIEKLTTQNYMYCKDEFDRLLAEKLRKGYEIVD